MHSASYQSSDISPEALDAFLTWIKDNRVQFARFAIRGGADEHRKEILSRLLPSQRQLWELSVYDPPLDIGDYLPVENKLRRLFLHSAFENPTPWNTPLPSSLTVLFLTRDVEMSTFEAALVQCPKLERVFAHVCHREPAKPRIQGRFVLPNLSYLGINHHPSALTASRMHKRTARDCPHRIASHRIKVASTTSGGAGALLPPRRACQHHERGP